MLLVNEGQFGPVSLNVKDMAELTEANRKSPQPHPDVAKRACFVPAQMQAGK